jgi:hypothetical protein
LCKVAAPAEIEVDVRRRDFQLVEEDSGQFVIVVLASVEQHLLVTAAQQLRHGRGLHKLGSVSDDGGDAHASGLGSS